MITGYTLLGSVHSVLFKIVPLFNSNSLDVVKEYFTQYALHDQDLMGSKESVEKVLALVPEDILFLVYRIFAA